MAGGGKRVGAGRKPGAVTKRVRAIAEKALADGVDPLTVMLANMRHYHKLAADAEKLLEGVTASELVGKSELSVKEQVDILLAEVRKAADLRDRSQLCARDAARYLHAPLAAVNATGTAQDAVPVPERLKEYERQQAIEASPKVVEMRRK